MWAHPCHICRGLGSPLPTSATTRFIAKALFDGYHCGAHLCAPLYKFLLGAPLMAADLMALDRQLALGLEQLLVSTRIGYSEYSHRVL